MLGSISAIEVGNKDQQPLGYEIIITTTKNLSPLAGENTFNGILLVLW